MFDFMALITAQSALAVLLATTAARIGLPVPAAPLLVVAGSLIAVDLVPLVDVLVAALIGNLVGDGAWFYAGRKYGQRILRLLCRISMSPDTCVQQSQSLIQRWGGASLITAKYVPGVSLIAPPLLGALGMSLPRFLWFELLSAAIWSGGFLALGWIFNTQVQTILLSLAQAGGVAAVAMALVLGVVLVRHWRRRRALRALEMPRITVAQLRALQQQAVPPVVVDVRGSTGLAMAPQRIPGAQSYSLQELREGAALNFPADADVVLYCNCPNEASAVQGAQLLLARGRKNVHPLAGGLEAWTLAGHPVEAVVLPAEPKPSTAPT